ncbi:MAG: hypothetical protein SAK29_09855 [Scytonema sp. PMC 1069.18]|nr:hypothetical protein [Scytonema sp. PMC 1069.18]
MQVNFIYGNHLKTPLSVETVRMRDQGGNTTRLIPNGVSHNNKIQR